MTFLEDFFKGGEIIVVNEQPADTVYNAKIFKEEKELSF